VVEVLGTMELVVVSMIIPLMDMVLLQEAVMAVAVAVAATWAVGIGT
jgi:hypothetical protein